MSIRSRSIKRRVKRFITKVVSTALLSSLWFGISCAPKATAFEKYKPLVEWVADSNLETEIADSLFDRINRIRIEHGIKPLERKQKLRMFAISHSIEMGINEYISHENWAGKSFRYRVKMFGIDAEHIGENCAYNELRCNFVIWDDRRTCIKKHFTEVIESIVHTWMESDGHREHILNNDFIYSGMGVYIECDSNCWTKTSFECTDCREWCKVYTTQIFATEWLGKGFSIKKNGNCIYKLYR